MLSYLVKRYVKLLILDDYDRKHIIRRYSYNEMIVIYEELALYKAFEMRTHRASETQCDEKEG